MKKAILPIFAALSLALTPAAFASDKFEIDFDYSTVEVATEEGAERIYSDLEAAVEEQCEPASGRTLHLQDRADTNVCIDEAISAAVSTMQEPEVTKVHKAKRG